MLKATKLQYRENYVKRTLHVLWWEFEPTISVVELPR
jgi:hypothetical protein